MLKHFEFTISKKEIILNFKETQIYNVYLVLFIRISTGALDDSVYIKHIDKM